MFEIFAAWREVVHVSEWTGMSVGALGALGAAAWFLPPLRSLAIKAAIAIGIGYGALIYGNHTGRADVLAEWDAAKVKAAAAEKAADVDAQKALDAKFDPIGEVLQQRTDDLTRGNGDESKIVGAMAGACQLGSAPLRLRKR